MKKYSVTILFLATILISDALLDEILNILKLNGTIKLPQLLCDIDGFLPLDDTLKYLPGRPEIEAYKNMTTPEFIKSQGYVAETHFVTTPDGYILQMHRIPYGKKGPGLSKGKIAYLEHGFLCSSFDWIVDTRDLSIACLLADAGYDVWMNNKRGNTYSRNHTTLDPDKDKEKFWNFTAHEMAIYDVPTAVDYVLNTTNKSQVYYFGYSMGTTVFFMLMSERNEYAKKIKAAALMAPVATITNIKGGFSLIAATDFLLKYVMNALQQYEFLPNSVLFKGLANACSVANGAITFACSDLLFSLFGFNCAELNRTMVPVYYAHTPAGTSYKLVDHFGQIYKSGIFRPYVEEGSGTIPPPYNLSVNTPPIAIFHGLNDYLSTPKDLETYIKNFTNLVFNYTVADKLWSHLDCIYGINAKPKLYDFVLNFMKNY